MHSKKGGQMKLLKVIKSQKGFTLLEVLLVVAVIALLAGIVIIAINPNKNLGDTRNSQRSSDVTTILNAVYQYSLDNNGGAPPTGTGAAISATPTEICKTGATCTGLIDLGVLATNGKYLVSLPLDPQCPTLCDANGNGYEISKDTNNRYTVSAPNAEQDKTISATR
ncbi:MAG TPA: prepilin-type N-terminal cleavage/methylation domain-containing protein [Candidatus Saccharimonadales bacterium]|nr:prepilin-type N-terminal cleavage/methylation domain-containing protein [Candidatus Saccharimonadales bacterium]